MSAGLPQFEINTYTSQIFWLFISLSIIFIGIWKFVIPQYEAILKKRSHKLKNELLLASILQHDYAAIRRDKMMKINQTKKQFADMLETHTKALTKEYSSMMKKLQKEHDDRIEEFHLSIAKQNQEMISEPFIQECKKQILQKFTSGYFISMQGDRVVE